MPDDDLVARTLLRVLGATHPRRSAPPRGVVEPQLSGAHPDARDPRELGAAIEALLDERGWMKQANEAKVMARWEQFVGAEVAAHARPLRLLAGELTVEADSSAWATQLSLLAGEIVKRIAAELGPGVVETVRAQGPTGARTGRGRWRVPEAGRARRKAP